MDLHNTAIKRYASELFETNTEDRQIDTISEFIQPTLEVQPTINIVRTQTNDGTMYTTPADKSFFLTNISISAGNNPGTTTGSATISVTTREGTALVFAVRVPTAGDGVTTIVGTSESTDMAFPMRGIELAKSSTISAGLTGPDNGQFMFAGYLGSDRS